MASFAVVVGCIALYFSCILHICDARVDHRNVMFLMSSDSGRSGGYNRSKDVSDDGVRKYTSNGAGSGGANPELARDVASQSVGRSRSTLNEEMAGIRDRCWEMTDGGTRLLDGLIPCLKISSVLHLDNFLSHDVIPVTELVEFVKDPTGGTDGFNITGVAAFDAYVSDILQKDWIQLISERTGNFLKRHSLRIRLTEASIEGRRRRRHHMFAMMMVGFMIMASILVPLGFQFLTVLGGKSLLMAKMALIMSAINGLKKIATSNIGYGLYHYSPEVGHRQDFHDKVFQQKPPIPSHNFPFDNVVI